MKSLLATLVLFVATSAFGSVELGKYTAVDKETGSIQASFDLKPGGALTFSVQGAVPKTDCTGTYSVAGKEFSANIRCQSPLLQQANVKIDISNVTPAGVRSAAGVEVDVKIDALGGDVTKFILKKAD